MTFTAPVTEQLFVLKHITGIDELAAHARFADAEWFAQAARAEASKACSGGASASKAGAGAAPHPGRGRRRRAVAPGLDHAATG